MISVEVNVAIIKCNEITRCVKIFPSDSITRNCQILASVIN